MLRSFSKNASGMKRTVSEKIFFGAGFGCVFMLIYPVVLGLMSGFYSIKDTFDKRFGLRLESFLRKVAYD